MRPGRVGHSAGYCQECRFCSVNQQALPSCSVTYVFEHMFRFAGASIAHKVVVKFDCWYVFHIEFLVLKIIIHEFFDGNVLGPPCLFYSCRKMMGDVPGIREDNETPSSGPSSRNKRSPLSSSYVSGGSS